MVLLFLFPALFPRKTSPANVWDSNDKRVARFYHRNRGLLTAYDVIEETGKKYKVYNVARGRYLYLSVYCDGRQIAQINKDLHTVNNKDNYTLYLLDDDVESADMLSLFVLYYDSLNHGNQGEVFVGVKKNWSWTWSKTDRFYNEDWLSTRFGVYALEEPD